MGKPAISNEFTMDIGQLTMGKPASSDGLTVVGNVRWESAKHNEQCSISDGQYKQYKQYKQVKLKAMGNKQWE